jgi:hypothetical protein
LASLGFAELLSRTQSRTPQNLEDAAPQNRNDRGQFLWALPLISAVFTLLAMGFWLPYIGPFMLVALGPVIIAVAVCLVLRANRGARWAMAILVVFTAVDLGAYGMSYAVFGHTDSLPKFIANIDVPPGLPPQRVALDLANGTEAAPGQKTVRAGDEILLAGCQRVDGYAGLEPAKQLDYRDPAALRAAGVKWLTAQAGTQVRDAGHVGWLAKRERTVMTPGEPVYSAGKGALWMRMSKPRPRAWLVNRTIPTENAAADIGRISLVDEALVDKNVIAIEPGPKTLNSTVDTSPTNSGLVALPDASKTGVVTTIADRPGSISLSVNCPTQQFLVVGESYHTGWKATIDRQNVPVLRANGDFMGVAVGPGEHEIALKFQPESLQAGLLTSAFGLGLMVVVLVTAPWPIGRRA